MNKIFKTFALAAAMFGAGTATNVQHEMPAFLNEPNAQFISSNFVGGRSKSKSHLKKARKNANKKRKAAIKMQRTSRQINRA